MFPKNLFNLSHIHVLAKKEKIHNLCIASIVYTLTCKVIFGRKTANSKFWIISIIQLV